MSQKNIFRMPVIVFLLLSSLEVDSQTLKGTNKTTWAGNTFSGNPDWVQGYMYSAAVGPEGKVVTIAHWDEAHKECGIYHEGKTAGAIGTTGFVLAGNWSNVFIPNGTSIRLFEYDGSLIKSTINVAFNPSYMGTNEKYLAITENGSNAVAVYNISGGQVKRWTVKNPGAVAIDSSNNIWVVSGVQIPEDRYERKWLIYDENYRPRIYKYNLQGETPSDSLLLYPEWRPTCLNMDRNTNRLMVGDDGPKHQVHFINVENEPVLDYSFGTEGGLSAGDPGIITPTKFWAMKGLGTDTVGNIYVVISEDGSQIRSLKPNGELNWELNSAHFVDVMNFDQYSDGRYLYGKNEIIEMDYSKQDAGTEWKMYAYTQDRTANPDDPRNFYTGLGHEFSTVWPRIIEGEMYLFSAGMYGIKPHVFKFNGKIASPAAYLKLNGSNAFYQDKEGSYWESSANQIIKTPLAAVEENGDLVYAKPVVVSAIPSPFSSVSRILYEEDRDIMFLTGSGDQIARYDNWSKGNRIAKFKGVLPSNYNQGVAVAGDYIFACGVTTKSRVMVYSADDFTYLGMLEAGDEVGGAENTGWVDIPYGMFATKRSNGEYIVTVEDDYKMKSVVFRWCPDGTCIQSPPLVKFDNLVNKTTLSPGQSLAVEVSAADPNGTVDSIRLYVDTTLLAVTHGDKLSFNWNAIPQGNYYLLAKAYDNDGLSASTFPLKVYVKNTDSEAPGTPGTPGSKNIKTTYLTLYWNKSIDNSEIAGYRILRDGKVEYTSGGTDTTFIATGLTPDTEYRFAVMAFDKSLNNSDTSAIHVVKTLPGGPFKGTPIAIPGNVDLEHFDLGGEGVSYHDADIEHIGGTYRSDESVDIAEAPTGYYVGWIEVGEWLRFTVDVEKEGDYDFYLVTAGGSGSINLEFSNGPKVYKVDFGSTGDWDIWKTSIRASVHLLAGVQELTLTMNDHQVSIDNLLITEHETINPYVPIDLMVDTVISGKVSLIWSMPPNSKNISSYKVYMDGEFLKSSPTTLYTTKKLTPGQTYSFTVSSVSAVGNESELCIPLSVTIPGASAIDDDTDDASILLFPMPAREQVSIRTDASFSNGYQVEILDYSGRICYTQAFEGNGEQSISTNKLAKGVYLIRITSSGNCVSRQLVIQ